MINIGTHNLSLEKTGIRLTKEEAEATAAHADALQLENWNLRKENTRLRQLVDELNGKAAA